MVLEDLGFRPSPTTTGYTEEYTAVSPELLSRHDADVIFVGLPEESTLSPKIASLLKTTHAGRNDRVFTVSRDIWGLEVRRGAVRRAGRRGAPPDGAADRAGPRVQLVI